MSSNTLLSEQLKAFTLHYSPRSAYSCVVAFALSLAEDAGYRPPISIQYKPVEFGRWEHLGEEYLKINPKAEVPVLTNPFFVDPPIRSCLGILEYLACWFPSLFPEEHKDFVKECIEDLELDKLGFRLVTPEAAKVWEKRSLDVIDRMLMTHISPEYRAALLRKRTNIISIIRQCSDPAELEELKARFASTFLFVERILAKYKKPRSLWMLGTKHGTALDAYVAMLVYKLYCVNRQDLLTSGMVREWAIRIITGYHRSIQPPPSQDGTFIFPREEEVGFSKSENPEQDMDVLPGFERRN